MSCLGVPPGPVQKHLLVLTCADVRSCFGNIYVAVFSSSHRPRKTSLHPYQLLAFDNLQPAIDVAYARVFSRRNKQKTTGFSRAQLEEKNADKLAKLRTAWLQAWKNLEAHSHRLFLLLPLNQPGQRSQVARTTGTERGRLRTESRPDAELASNKTARQEQSLGSRGSTTSFTISRAKEEWRLGRWGRVLSWRHTRRKGLDSVQ